MPLNRRMQVSRSKGYENDLIRTNQSYTKAHPLKFQPREISYKVIIKMVFYPCTKGEVDKWTEERTWKQPDPCPVSWFTTKETAVGPRKLQWENTDLFKQLCWKQWIVTSHHTQKFVLMNCNGPSICFNRPSR